MLSSGAFLAAAVWGASGVATSIFGGPSIPVDIQGAGKKHPSPTKISLFSE